MDGGDAKGFQDDVLDEGSAESDTNLPTTLAGTSVKLERKIGHTKERPFRHPALAKRALRGT